MRGYSQGSCGLQKSYRRTDERTDGRTDIKCLSNGRKNLIILKDQTKFFLSKFSRHPLVDINNINVPGQRICSHFLVQIPRADAEIVTNKLPLIFFLLICYFCILMYNIPTRIFTDLYLKSKRQHFRVFVYKSNLYFFFI